MHFVNYIFNNIEQLQMTTVCNDSVHYLFILSSKMQYSFGCLTQFYLLLIIPFELTCNNIPFRITVAAFKIINNSNQFHKRLQQINCSKHLFHTFIIQIYFSFFEQINYKIQHNSVQDYALTYLALKFCIQIQLTKRKAEFTNQIKSLICKEPVTLYKKKTFKSICLKHDKN